MRIPSFSFSTKIVARFSRASASRVNSHLPVLNDIYNGRGSVSKLSGQQPTVYSRSLVHRYCWVASPRRVSLIYKHHRRRLQRCRRLSLMIHHCKGHSGNCWVDIFHDKLLESCFSRYQFPHKCLNQWPMLR